MSYLAIVTAYGTLSFLLIYTSLNIKNKELEVMKLVLFPIGVTFAFITALIPYLIVLNPTDLTKSEPVILGLFTVVAGLMVMFNYLYLKHIIINVIKKKG